MDVAYRNQMSHRSERIYSLGPVTCLQLNYLRVLICGGGD